MLECRRLGLEFSYRVCCLRSRPVASQGLRSLITSRGRFPCFWVVCGGHRLGGGRSGEGGAGSPRRAAPSSGAFSLFRESEGGTPIT